MGVRRRRDHESGVALRRLIQWLVGPVESVMAKTATQARRIEAEDTGVAILKFRSGALGVIEVNVLDLPEEPRGLDHDPRRAAAR